jgi:hypothetical protein
MRDPELVARAQRAATRPESAWEQCRGHGLAVAPGQQVPPRQVQLPQVPIHQVPMQQVPLQSVRCSQVRFSRSNRVSFPAR